MVLADRGATINLSPEVPAILCAGAYLLQSRDSILKVYDAVTDTKTWMCLICGWIYDEALGAPDDGIAPGTLWADVPMNWVCPECGARKEDFELVQI